MFGLKYDEPPEIRYEEHDVFCKDGGKIQVWVCTYPPCKTEGRVVIINHGHTYGAGSNYIKQLCYDTNMAGFQAVVHVRRGIESNDLTTPKFMNINHKDDFKASMKYINERFNNPDLYGIGLSMGANYLCHYAGSTMDKCPFKAIVCMATPFELNMVTDGLKAPGNGLCNLGLLDGCKT